MDYHSSKNQNNETETDEKDTKCLATAENLKTLESITTVSLCFNTNTELCLVSEVLSLGPSRIHNCVLAKVTLGHALKLFQVPHLLKELDKELRAVRNEERSIMVLRTYFDRKINVLFEALFNKFSPLEWKNSKRALELQKGVALVNGALIVLYNRFVHSAEWATADFRFSSCYPVEIGILNDEELLNQISNHQVLSEVCSLSSIKHENVIPHLKVFMQLCHHAITAFISGEKNQFVEVKKLALDSFNELLLGYEKLVKDLRKLYRNCEKDPKLASIKDSLWRALVDSGKKMRWMTRLKDQPFISNSLFLHECYGRSLEAAILEYTYLLSTCGKVAQKSPPRRKSETVEPYYECDGHGYINFVDPSLFGASSKTNQNIQKNSVKFHQNATVLEDSTSSFKNPEYNLSPSKHLRRSQTFDESTTYKKNEESLRARTYSHNPLESENEVSSLLSSSKTHNDTIFSSESPHRCLLQSLASYICNGTLLSKAKAMEILSKDFNFTKVSLDEETSYWLFTDTLDAYSQHLQKEFLCDNILENLHYEMEKSLDSLAVTLRSALLATSE